MSTSDPSRETVLASVATDSKVAENQPAGIGALPDLAMITRLANEFFSALPVHPGPGSLPASASAPATPSVDLPTDAKGGAEGDTRPSINSQATTDPAPAVGLKESDLLFATPTYPSAAELFSFPGVPGTQPAVSVPGLSQSAPGLNEVQLSAIPFSLTDATPRPSAYHSASPPAVPGAPAYFSSEPATSPFSVAPAFPIEILAFPDVGAPVGVPPTPSSPPTGVDAAVPAAPLSSGYSRRETKTTAPATAEPRLDIREFRPEVVPNIGLAKRLFDPHVIKRDFPILQEQVHGRPLVWLDNAATTQKPNAVIDRVSYFYQHENSNIHRAAHTLAARSTDAYEGARDKVRRFLNARSTNEIIFVRGATEGINLVAKSWGHRNVQKDDEIVLTWLEHHANIVPWQQLAAEKGARIRVAPVDDSGQIILEEYEKLLNPRTRIVAFPQVSNALGTITPAKEMIEMAHRHGACVLLDAAQSVAHMTTDVQALDCEFLVLSGHKIFAPTGVGVVFGKEDILKNTPPWQGGGNMIMDVTFEKTVYNTPPARFEAGTATLADAVGLGAALDYLDEVGMENISRAEHELVQYGTAQLLTVPGLRLIGTAKEKAGVLSFLLDSMPPEEVGKALDQEGIAVRAGHHCAQPILRRMGVEKTVRPSLALYNTHEDIDALVSALFRIQSGQSYRR